MTSPNFEARIDLPDPPRPKMTTRFTFEAYTRTAFSNDFCQVHYPPPNATVRERRKSKQIRTACRTVVHCRDLWMQDMKASAFYRIAAVLLVLFAIGHTLGFRQNNPEWGASSVISSMQATRFDAQGFSRTYWDFFSAFGLFFSVFLLFAAVLAWQLGSVRAEAVGVFMRSTAWALAISFALITALSFRYAFTTPIVFSTVITVCLIAAAWRSSKPIQHST